MGLGSFVADDPIGAVAGEVEPNLELPGTSRFDSQKLANSHDRIGTKVSLCLEKVCQCHRGK